VNVEIHKGDYDTPGPCWIPRVLTENGVIALYGPGTPLKPSIRCKCGEVCNIALHHVHADGRVTRSFYHAEFREWEENGKKYTHEPGCGWHVFLKLLDYNLGEFPPVP
jgi:hypothetical protein